MTPPDCARACFGKVAYSRKRIAARAAKDARQRTGHLIVSYRCPNDRRHGWHIGHAPRWWRETHTV